MHKKLFLILIFLGLFFDVNAKSDEIDSLKQLLSHDIERENRVASLNRLAFLIREKDIQQSLIWSTRAEDLATKLQDSIQLSRAKGNLGWIYFRLGVWDKAFRYSKEAYLIASAKRDKYELGMALNNLGSLYYWQENFEDAIKNFKAAYRLGLEINDPYLITRSLANVSQNYTLKGEFDSAYHYAEMGIKSNEEFGEKYFMAYIFRILGDLQMEKGEILNAINTYEQSLQITNPEQIITTQASLLHRLGKVYFMSGNVSKAINYLEKGQKICLDNGFLDELVITYSLLAEIYESKGNIAEAFKYQKAYTELNAERQLASNKDKIALMQAKFEVEKTDSEISVLTIQNSLKELQIQSAKKIIFVVVLFALIFIGLIIWLVIVSKKIKISNEKLKEKRTFLEAQRQELKIKSFDLMESNRSKDRILSILGHDLKSPVAQLKGVLDLLHSQELTKEEFDEISHILKRNVDGLFENIDNILSWSKSQMEGFKVQMLPTNLKKIIRPCLELLQYQANSKEINITINIIEELAMVDQDLLQLIIRNLLSNSIKFSNKGSNIDIYSQKEGEFIKLVIQDYGIGMSEIQLDTFLNQQVSLLESSVGTDKEKGTGLGLNLCKEFVGLMGGNLHLESKKGEGTTAILYLQSVGISSSHKVV